MGEGAQAQCCQICLEAPEPSDASLLTQLCGSQCEAQVCRQCLTSHVRVSLERFYAGVVPRVRCPICLDPMAKSQWQPHITREDSAEPSHELADRYETLCSQACGLTSPCCHKADYSHLPKAVCSASHDAAGEFAKALLAIAPKAQQTAIASLWSQSLEFQAHKQTPRSVVELILQQFPQPSETAAKVTDELLRRIQDDERRATLLLSFLALRPLAVTRCCGHMFCFNCKRGSHHSSCDNGGAVNLATSMVQCRSCRATLVKVDGCAAVTCLCGFVMNWDDELKYKQTHMKKLVSWDIFFDPQAFSAWLQWKNQVRVLRGELAAAIFGYRSRRFSICLVRYRYVLRPWIRRFVRRWRFQNYVVKLIPSAWQHMQLETYVKTLRETQTPTFALAMSPSAQFSIGIDPKAHLPRTSLANRRRRALNSRKRAFERRKRMQKSAPAALFGCHGFGEVVTDSQFDDAMDYPMEDVSNA